VDEIGFGFARGREDPLDVEVRLARRCGPEADGEIGLAHERKRRVGVAVHRDGPDAHAPSGPEDPACDLAAVRDEESRHRGQRALRRSRNARIPS
jgi:hypothetical protein